MSEQQRIVWLLSMVPCAEVNRAMQDITGIQYDTVEQNNDITMARQKRDMKDTRTLPVTLTDRSPFDQSIVLRNIIMTGAHAGTAVNVDDAKHIGNRVMATMNNQLVTKYTFKRKDQATTSAYKSSVKMGMSFCKLTHNSCSND